MKYETEGNIITDIKHLCKQIIESFEKAISIEEKYNLLVDGIEIKYKSVKRWYEFWK
jgi:hypothetical protein